MDSLALNREKGKEVIQSIQQKDQIEVAKVGTPIWLLSTKICFWCSFGRFLFI